MSTQTISLLQLFRLISVQSTGLKFLSTICSYFRIIVPFMLNTPLSNISFRENICICIIIPIAFTYKKHDMCVKFLNPLFFFQSLANVVYHLPGQLFLKYVLEKISSERCSRKKAPMVLQVQETLQPEKARQSSTVKAMRCPEVMKML